MERNITKKSLAKRIMVRFFRFELMQRQWGRKWMGGTFYLIDPQGLQMGPFWSDQIITSCQSKVISEEAY
jgi:hypothetical protein